MKRTLIATVLLAAVGCTVGPDYAKPETAPPEGWTEAKGDKVSSKSADLTKWWTAFGDATLNRLVERAVEANYDLKIAAARVRESRAQAGYSRGALHPEIAGATSYARQRVSENAGVPVTGEPEGDFYRTGFDASWEIDVFGGTRRAIEAADADLEATIEERRAVLVSLMGEVARAYVDLRGSQRLAEVAKRNVVSAQATLDLTRTRLRAGLATDLDVARAEAQLANTQSEVPEAERSIRFAIHRLGVLLGREPGSLAAELETAGPIPAPPATILVGLPSELVARRPDLRRAERQLAAATARIGVATADLYPKFSITGAFGLESVESSDLSKSASKAWSIGPVMRWPNYLGGRLTHNIEIQDARAEQALASYRRSILTAFEEVENALVSYLREWEQRRSLEEAAKASRRSVELAGDLYRKGLTSFLDVLESERDLHEAERRLAASEAAVSLDVVALYKALGGGWDISE